MPCADASVESILYVLLIALFAYIPGTRYIFYLGTCTFVHGSLLLYMDVPGMYDYSGIDSIVCALD